MASNQLVAHGAKRVGHVESAKVRRDLRQEDTLEDVIADFLAQACEVSSLDGVDDLVRLFKDELTQRPKRLLPIPRTAARTAQSRHDFNEPIELLTLIRHVDLGAR
jgi:hypothetical protein